MAKATDKEERIDDKVFGKACGNLKTLFYYSPDDERAQMAMKTLRELSLSEGQLAKIYSAIKKGLDDEQRKQKDTLMDFILHPDKEFKGDKKMADTFELTEDQKKFLGEHGIKPEEVTSKEVYEALVTQFTPAETFNLEEATKTLLATRGINAEDIAKISSIEDLEKSLKPAEGSEGKDGKDDADKDKDKKEFVLSDADKEFLKKHGIEENAVTSKELLDTLKAQFTDEMKSEDAITLTDDMKKWLEEKGLEADKIKTVGDLVENVNKTAPLDVDEKEKEGRDDRVVDSDWVKRKEAYYNKLAEKSEISDYKLLRADSVFSAEMNGATLTYSSPTSVSVSPEAPISVFETIVKDPDNKYRPINFSDSMSKDMQARLYAACILNGAALGKNAPLELSDDQLKLIKAELGDRYSDFESKYADLHKPAEPEKEDEDKDKDDKDKEPKPFDDKTVEDIKKGLADQYEIAAMKADGRIKLNYLPVGEKKPDGTQEVEVFTEGKDEDVAKYKELMTKSAEQVEFLKGKFGDNPAQFRDIVAAVLPELKEKAKSDELSTKLDKIKAKIDSDKKRDGKDREDWQKEREARRLESDNIKKALLGITESYKTKDETGKEVEHKPLSGDELKKYIEKEEVSVYTWVRLGGKEENAPEACKAVTKAINDRIHPEKGKTGEGR